jgi:hypothetical protein
MPPVPALPSNTPEILAQPLGWVVLVLFLFVVAGMGVIWMLLQDARYREALMLAAANKTADALTGLSSLQARFEARLDGHEENDDKAMEGINDNIREIRSILGGYRGTFNASGDSSSPSKPL